MRRLILAAVVGITTREVQAQAGIDEWISRLIGPGLADGPPAVVSAASAQGAQGAGVGGLQVGGDVNGNVDGTGLLLPGAGGLQLMDPNELLEEMQKELEQEAFSLAKLFDQFRNFSPFGSGWGNGLGISGSGVGGVGSGVGGLDGWGFPSGLFPSGLFPSGLFPGIGNSAAGNSAAGNSDRFGMSPLMSMLFGGESSDILPNVTISGAECLITIDLKGMDMNSTSIKVYSSPQQIDLEISYVKSDYSQQTEGEESDPNPDQGNNESTDLQLSQSGQASLSKPNLRGYASMTSLTTIRSFPAPQECDMTDSSSKATVNRDTNQLLIKFPKNPEGQGAAQGNSGEGEGQGEGNGNSAANLPLPPGVEAQNAEGQNGGENGGLEKEVQGALDGNSPALDIRGQDPSREDNVNGNPKALQSENSGNSGNSGKLGNSAGNSAGNLGDGEIGGQENSRSSWWSPKDLIRSRNSAANATETVKIPKIPVPLVRSDEF